jgi:hypothetical protein
MKPISHRVGVMPFLAALLVFAALVLALGGCGGGDDEGASPTAEQTTASEPARQAPPSPSEVVARPSDFPGGYTVDHEVTGPTTLAEELEYATSREHAAAIRAQRVAGHEITAQNLDTLQGIYCSATVYRSSEGARKVFRLWTEQAAAQASEEGWTLERTGVDEPLGEETVAFNGETAEGTLFMILWRDHEVIGECGGAGILVNDPPVDETVEVARAQQERIAEALA